MSSPLSQLVVDSAAVDEARLAECLKDRVGIDDESGSIVFLDGFHDLPGAKEQILTFLLARKAASLLGRGPCEATPRTEIAEESGIPTGTVGRVVRELAEARLVAQDSERRYFIPSVKVPAVQRLLPTQEAP